MNLGRKSPTTLKVELSCISRAQSSATNTCSTTTKQWSRAEGFEQGAEQRGVGLHLQGEILGGLLRGGWEGVGSQLAAAGGPQRREAGRRGETMAAQAGQEGSARPATSEASRVCAAASAATNASAMEPACRETNPSQPSAPPSPTQPTHQPHRPSPTGPLTSLFGSALTDLLLPRAAWKAAKDSKATSRIKQLHIPCTGAPGRQGRSARAAEGRCSTCGWREQNSVGLLAAGGPAASGRRCRSQRGNQSCGACGKCKSREYKESTADMWEMSRALGFGGLQAWRFEVSGSSGVELSWVGLKAHPGEGLAQVDGVADGTGS